MKQYSWKYGYDVSNADAEKVGKELEEIESFGEITPERVLGYAERHKRSELYKCFEWDDSEAGRKYRLAQASRVLCNISVEIKEEPVRKQRIYVNVVSSKSGIKTFKNIKDVLEDDEEYRQLVDKARKDFENCKSNYETLLNRDDLKDLVFEIYRNI